MQGLNDALQPLNVVALYQTMMTALDLQQAELLHLKSSAGLVRAELQGLIEDVCAYGGLLFSSAVVLSSGFLLAEQFSQHFK